MANNLHIEVYYALKERQYRYSLNVPDGTTIAEAIRLCGLLEECPDINLDQNKVGVYSEIRSLDDTVAEGDRIEIYRPLQTDPKEARRQRAKQSKQ